jgi:predicted transposase/invertase (TIGR01784 family)
VLKTTGRNIISVEIIGNHKFSAEVLGDKTSVLDVRAITDDKSHINIEVQLTNYGEMEKRSLFYWSRDYSKGLEAGDTYQELVDVISINIVNYEFIPEVADYHTSFHIREDKHHEYILTKNLEIHFIDMVKFRQLLDKDMQDALIRWLAYFNKNTNPEILKEVIKMDPAIQKVEEKFRYVSNDKEILRAYHMREMAMFDYATGMKTVQMKSELKGIQKGKLEVAKELKASTNMSANQISNLTGLSIDEIESL